MAAVVDRSRGEPTVPRPVRLDVVVTVDMADPLEAAVTLPFESTVMSQLVYDPGMTAVLDRSRGSARVPAPDKFVATCTCFSLTGVMRVPSPSRVTLSVFIVVGVIAPGMTVRGLPTVPSPPNVASHETVVRGVAPLMTAVNRPFASTFMLA